MSGDGLRPKRASRAAVAGALAVLVTVTFPSEPPAHAAESVAAAPSPDAQRLVFLLEYVGTDYAAAVRDGAVVNPLEYGEMLRMSQTLLDNYRARPGAWAMVTAELTELHAMIRRREPAEQIWTTSRRLLPALIGSLAVDVRPQRLPDLANGQRLWARDCASCHGPSGAGDGAAAAALNPPPAAFTGPALDQLSPRQVFNALTFGIEGTQMPPFAPAYSEEDRWDVAFFVMTLRRPSTPRQPEPGQTLSLHELATQANVELLRTLRQRWPDASADEVHWWRTHLAAASLPSPTAPPAPPSASVAAALQLQEAFGQVAERVRPRVVGITGYVRDAAWSPEKLEPARGAAWMAANAEALRYPGFRPIRSGSGLLMDGEYVISSNRLVRDDRGAVVPLVDVELHDQTHIASGVAASEPTLDLAILRHPPLPASAALPPLVLGDSDRLQTGNWVIALGDPPGPETIFAVGVVSSPALRQCYQEERSATLLQSSLAIGAGGVGGPVVDIFGQVVGINIQLGETTTAALAADVDAMRPARTLPINLALNLFEALKVAQSQRSPWLGVSVLELPLARRRLGPAARDIVFPRTGVYIDDVFAPSPASRAGVRPGDFLVALGGHPLLSVADFQTWLYVLGIGTQVDLDLLRDGQPLRLVAPIEVRPDIAAMR